MNVQVAFDDRIIDEYTSVLKRPKFQFNEQDIEALIDHVSSYGLQVSAVPLGIRNIPDPSDLPFAEVAVSANVDALVTGDIGHFDFLDRYKIAVVTPAELIQIIEGLAAE
jgi:predicted nucleic acid-binding protein